jgi:hypothetical protein
MAVFETERRILKERKGNETKEDPSER